MHARNKNQYIRMATGRRSTTLGDQQNREFRRRIGLGRTIDRQSKFKVQVGPRPFDEGNWIKKLIFQLIFIKWRTVIYLKTKTGESRFLQEITFSPKNYYMEPMLLSRKM